MQESFPCPACLGDEWSPFEEYVFERKDERPSDGWHQKLETLRVLARILLFARPSRVPVRRRHLSKYQRLRRRILFDIWNSNGRLIGLRCRRCGFACYSPRPSTAEIEAKYAFVKTHEPSIGGQDAGDAKSLRLDHLRSERIFETLSTHMGGKRVLDYGGGNGKLLQAFLERGFQCHLADYSDVQLPGIAKVADDISGVNGEYDGIILSHVLEHVSDPGRLITQLGKHLKPTGAIYVEVPVEVWGGLRVDGDPVTHINYFTHASLRTLMQIHGFMVLDEFHGYGTYGRKRIEVTWIVARNGEQQAIFQPDATEELLYPSRVYSIRKAWHLF